MIGIQSVTNSIHTKAHIRLSLRPPAVGFTAKKPVTRTGLKDGPWQQLTRPVYQIAA